MGDDALLKGSGEDVSSTHAHHVHCPRNCKQLSCKRKHPPKLFNSKEPKVIISTVSGLHISQASCEFCYI